MQAKNIAVGGQSVMTLFKKNQQVILEKIIERFGTENVPKRRTIGLVGSSNLSLPLEIPISSPDKPNQHGQPKTELSDSETTRLVSIR